MKDAIWLLAILALALPGTIVWRVPLIARMSPAGRWALAFVAGAPIAALLLYVYALVGIRWTRVSLAIPLIIIAALGVRRLAGAFAIPEHLHQMQISFLLVASYAIADARATCGDLIYIWAPKGQAFYTARTINTKFLAFPFYDLMHPDYPPLVPFTYAFGSIFAHSTSLWGPLFLSVFILLAIGGTVRGFGGSSSATTLVISVLSFAFVAAYLPGGADPFLLLFESVALIALTFAPDSRDARWIAAAALAGAAFTKVEGAAFVMVVAMAFLLTQRNIGRALILVIPAAALLGSWLLFAWHHKLLDQYARAHAQIYWRQLPGILNGILDRGTYHAIWLPWIVAALPMFAGTSWRRTALPLLVAAGTLGAAIFFYLHNPQPGFWIDTSADRILTTPLMCIAIASAATWKTAEVQ